MMKNYRWISLFIILLLAMVLVPAGAAFATPDKARKAKAGEEAPAEAPAKPKPANVAEVNGTAIAYEDFERQMEIMKQRVMRGRPGNLPDGMMKQMQTQVVRQMVAEELLFQESRNKGIKIGQEAVDAETLLEV